MRVNDFFCGAGGMGLGFKNAGFEIAGAWDFDKYAVESYRINVGDHVKQVDIKTMTGSDIPAADVWTFGFPCTDVSIAGGRAGMIKGETRSGLFYEVMRLLSEVEIKPKIIMAENVKMLRKLLPVLEEEYTAAGYKMYSVLYNSKYWGVPQNRERYFIVGVRNDITDTFIFPEEQKDYVPQLQDVLEEQVEAKYYIADHLVKRVLDEAETRIAAKLALVEKAASCSMRTRSYRNQPQRLEVRTDNICNTLTTVEKDALLLERQVVEAQSLFVTQQDAVAYACVSSYYKGISPSDVGNAKRTHVVEGVPCFRVRKLTPREYMRLQGFPDTFKQVVSNSQSYIQSGNAVTVPVAQGIAESILQFLG